MNEKMKNILKLLIIVFIFFNIGIAFRWIFNAFGYDLGTFSLSARAYVQAVISLTLSILVFLLYRKDFVKDWLDFKSDTKANIKKSLKLFLIFYGIKFGAAFVMALIAQIFNIDVLQSENQSVIEGLAGAAPLMIALSAVVFAPFLEEGIFRLGFRKVINNKYIFIIISGAIFGFMHIFPTELSLYLALTQSIVYVAMGVTLSAMYWKHPNIWIVTIVHLLNNLIGILTVLLLLLFTNG